MNHSIRQQMLARRRQLSDKQIAEASRAVVARIQALPIYTQSQHILLYRACQGEIDLFALFEHALSCNKLCYYPAITDYQHHIMQFVRVDQCTEWQANRFGIFEPVAVDQRRLLVEPALICVPAVAFDHAGGRLGMGGGYYDRYLADVSADHYRLAVAYDWQICDHLVQGSWDQTMSAVITPRRSY